MLLLAIFILAAFTLITAAPQLCDVSYAPQRSYTSLDLSEQRINTFSTWYMNGDGGESSLSLATFIAQNASTTRAVLEHYVTRGQGNAILNGFNTTNLIIFDIESAVPLKKLGTWLADERANGSMTFKSVVAAYKLRVSVAKSVFPHAKFAFYGSPGQPDSFSGENWTLAEEGYLTAAAGGIFDDIDYLLAVQYFGANVSEPTHEGHMFGTIVNKTIGLARRLKRSTGASIPIIANTKPTYNGGPLVAPYAGWLEPATIRALVERWSQEPLIERVVWWYYPLDDLQKDDQPTLAEQLEWWKTVDAWSACPPLRLVSKSAAAAAAEGEGEEGEVVALLPTGDADDRVCEEPLPNTHVRPGLNRQNIVTVFNLVRKTRLLIPPLSLSLSLSLHTHSNSFGFLSLLTTLTLPLSPLCIKGNGRRMSKGLPACAERGTVRGLVV